jgi:hypothetical protein
MTELLTGTSSLGAEVWVSGEPNGRHGRDGGPLIRAARSRSSRAGRGTSILRVLQPEKQAAGLQILGVAPHQNSHVHASRSAHEVSTSQPSDNAKASAPDVSRLSLANSEAKEHRTNFGAVYRRSISIF